jgi:diadenosine tetraphosphate (Ap4A) HIT family hydrolase
MTCPFCDRKGLAINDHWKLIEDLYPVSQGHHLLVPTSHVNSLRELNYSWESLGDALELAITVLTNEGMTDFNVGVNNGVNAGQTIDHVHFHIIPRVVGDVDSPRGGVRGVIPSKKDYL